MLFVISPAKALDYDTPAHVQAHTEPLFVKDAAELIRVLKPQSPAQVAGLMDLSDALATLNVGRYAAWTTKHSVKNAKQAVLAFDGDVYGGLDARSLNASQLAWAQDHLAILSGLYGVLRPLDLLQPYRLEMGTALATPRGKNLYQFWGPRIAEHLNERLAADKSPVLVNLASEEYFKAVDLKVLKARVVTCVFEEKKPGGWKVVSFMAKRARGLMARYAITHKASTPAKLEAFDAEGYAYAPEASTPDRLVFRRTAKP
jgi:cytoplasmic iron level regulating protein YaaA (DUF328/UPF0246 family)